MSGCAIVWCGRMDNKSCGSLSQKATGLCFQGHLRHAGVRFPLRAIRPWWLPSTHCYKRKKTHCSLTELESIMITCIKNVIIQMWLKSTTDDPDVVASCCRGRSVHSQSELTRWIDHTQIQSSQTNHEKCGHTPSAGHSKLSSFCASSSWRIKKNNMILSNTVLF